MRHGQTDWNVQHLLMGQQDIPLNAIGREQAIKAIQKVGELQIQTIYTSPLKRSFETAQLIGGPLHIEIVVIEDLREAYLGLHEGKKIKPYFLDAWIEGTTDLMLGESFQDVSKRIQPIMDQLKTLPHNRLVIGHGIVFLVMIKLLGIHIKLLKNTEIIHLR